MSSSVRAVGLRGLQHRREPGSVGRARFLPRSATRTRSTARRGRVRPADRLRAGRAPPCPPSASRRPPGTSNWNWDGVAPSAADLAGAHVRGEQVRSTPGHFGRDDAAARNARESTRSCPAKRACSWVARSIPSATSCARGSMPAAPLREKVRPRAPRWSPTARARSPARTARRRWGAGDCTSPVPDRAAAGGRVAVARAAQRHASCPMRADRSGSALPRCAARAPRRQALASSPASESHGNETHPAAPPVPSTPGAPLWLRAGRRLTGRQARSHNRGSS